MQIETNHPEHNSSWLSDLFRLAARAIGLLLAFIVLSGMVFLGAALWAGPEGYFLLYPAIDTRFAAGYSEANFRKVQPGMSKDEVLALLGPPLNDVSHQGWSYSEDGAFPFWDFAWLARGVNFDSEGRVIERTEMIAYD